MFGRFQAWLKTVPVAGQLALLLVVVCVTLTVIACVKQPERAVTAEHDLCEARAGWKAVALAAGGLLDPKPGTPRAKLEAAEDALCALVPLAPVVVAPVSSADAGL